MAKFYEVHIFYSRQDGYSVPVKTDRFMDEDEVIELANEKGLLTEDGDANHVDYVEEIDEKTYKLLGGK
jgi:hypothetical protein